MIKSYGKMIDQLYKTIKYTLYTSSFFSVLVSCFVAYGAIHHNDYCLPETSSFTCDIDIQTVLTDSFELFFYWFPQLCIVFLPVILLVRLMFAFYRSKKTV